MRTTPSTLLLSTLTLLGYALCTSASPAAVSNASLTTCTPHPASPLEQQAIFEKYVDLVWVKRTPIPAFVYVAANEIQHNPNLLDGAAASVPIFNALFGNTSVGVQIMHQAFAAPFGWVHWRLDGFYPAPAAALDVYRFEGGCIAEHWDVIQQVPADAISSHPLF
ncbi:hypothetical protein C8R46DRAFT_1308262, partial [Mycena filopes]